MALKLHLALYDSDPGDSSSSGTDGTVDDIEFAGVLSSGYVEADESGYVEAAESGSSAAAVDAGLQALGDEPSHQWNEFVLQGNTCDHTQEFSTSSPTR